MTNIKDTSAPSLREVLYQFATAQPQPNAELLASFISRFPEHEAALTEFAIAWALDAQTEEKKLQAAMVPAGPSAAVAGAMRRFQEQLRGPAPRDSLSAEESVPNPFASLTASGFDEVRRQVDVSKRFLMKIRDRHIQPNTIPDPFQHRLAQALGVPAQAVARHLWARQEIRPGMRFLAEQKPEALRQESFEDALLNSNLTPEQQARLLGG